MLLSVSAGAHCLEAEGHTLLVQECYEAGDDE